MCDQVFDMDRLIHDLDVLALMYSGIVATEDAPGFLATRLKFCEAMHRAVIREEDVLGLAMEAVEKWQHGQGVVHAWIFEGQSSPLTAGLRMISYFVIVDAIQDAEIGNDQILLEPLQVIVADRIGLWLEAMMSTLESARSAIEKDERVRKKVLSDLGVAIRLLMDKKAHIRVMYVHEAPEGVM